MILTPDRFADSFFFISIRVCEREEKRLCVFDDDKNPFSLLHDNRVCMAIDYRWSSANQHRWVSTHSNLYSRNISAVEVIVTQPKNIKSCLILRCGPIPQRRCVYLILLLSTEYQSFICRTTSTETDM